jgi:hypothetical protein
MNSNRVGSVNDVRGQDPFEHSSTRLMIPSRFSSPLVREIRMYRTEMGKWERVLRPPSSMIVRFKLPPIRLSSPHEAQLEQEEPEESAAGLRTQGTRGRRRRAWRIA